MAPPLPRARGDRRGWLIAAGVVAALALLAALLWPGDAPVRRERVIQEVSLVTPPPPPPPEPEEVVKEPEIIEPTDEPETSEKPVEQPSEQPDDAPSEAADTSEAAGLDKPADSGSDSFRLAAGKGGGLFGRGGGGGGNGLGEWRRYVESHILRALRLDPRTRSARGALRVSMDIGADGRIGGARLLSSTGDDRLDAAIADVLDRLPPLTRARPATVGGLTYATISMKRISG